MVIQELERQVNI